MIRLLVSILLLVAAMAAPVAVHAQEPLRVDITQGNLDPLPVALPNFISVDEALAERGADITRVITNDLASSGLFAPIDQSAYIEDIENIEDHDGIFNTTTSPVQTGLETT